MNLTNEPKLDLGSLRGAVLSLDEGLRVVDDKPWFALQSNGVKKTLIAGVIKEFEFVYEISFKMIKRTLEMEAASPEEVDESNFRDILRMAGEKGLIADVSAWFEYRKMRNITSHTYDDEKAEQVFRGTQKFLLDAWDLLKRLEKRNG